MKFIYDNERLCGDPFADPKWLPAHTDCAIQCDLYSQLCMSYVDSSYRSQQCTSLPIACRNAIKSYFGMLNYGQPDRSSGPFAPSFHRNSEMSNLIGSGDTEIEDFGKYPTILNMKMSPLARANWRPEFSTRRPIAVSLFRDQKSIFEHIQPPASKPEPPRVISSKDDEYISYDDTSINYAELRTTTAYPLYTTSTSFGDDPYSEQQNVFGSSAPWSSYGTTRKIPLGRGSLPVDRSRGRATAMRFYTEEYGADEANSNEIDPVIPPSPIRDVAPPAPPQPPAAMPPDYEQALLVEAETNSILSRALSLSSNSKHDIPRIAANNLNVLKQESHDVLYHKYDQYEKARDYSRKCCEWAVNGFCDRSWQRIRHLCAKSCGTIICSTTDKIRSCNRAIDVEALDCFDSNRSKAHASPNTALQKDELLNRIPTSAERLLEPANPSEQRRRSPERPSLVMKIHRVEDLPLSPLRFLPPNFSSNHQQKTDIRKHPIKAPSPKMSPFVVEEEMTKWNYFKHG
ncbi:hypothetical protein QR680_002018 [Steinernema hermaphroditum]|uniref:ShKT domain-containing protein n=1 Tax=Steinernema hermaphroditum TaxID=289476 RepID=A0AA39LHE2_9BILA|nr:hypothetical protein QR680_002018 [Steinernema hermaphroditum]